MRLGLAWCLVEMCVGQKLDLQKSRVRVLTPEKTSPPSQPMGTEQNNGSNKRS